MKKLLLALICIGSINFSCSFNSSRPINYTKNHSQGFYDDNYIYFLFEYEVWKRGKNYWFIMPIEGRKKTYFHEIIYYRYQPENNMLEKLAVLHDKTKRVNVKMSRFIKDDNDNIVCSYDAGYGEHMERLVGFFIWNTKTNSFIDTGHERIIPEDSPIVKKYFENYLSPWSANPGIIDMTRLINEILKDVTDEQYGLPDKW